jgi:hypothetical protein
MKGDAKEIALSGYLVDLGSLIRESGIEAKRAFDSAPRDKRDFEWGKLIAYNEVVSLMQQQAIAFDLSFEEIGLQGIDPDNDLV